MPVGATKTAKIFEFEAFGDDDEDFIRRVK